MKKIFQNFDLRKLCNAGVFLCFLIFTFLTVSILSPIVKSSAEVITKDYSIGAYTMSITNNTDVDLIASTNVYQQIYTTTNTVLYSNTCPKGAKIAISSTHDTNALVDGMGNTIPATVPGAELSDDSWGFSIDSGATWNAVPAIGHDPIIIYSSQESQNDVYEIPVLFGFKISRETVDGIYTSDVAYTITPDQDCFIYRINWDGAGGEIPEGFPEYLNQNDRLDLSTLPRPTRDYYDFAGWLVNGVTYTGDETSVDLNLQNDPSITVTTLWTPKNYPITYNLDGGSATNIVSYNIESDEIVINNPTRLGYSFRGWSGTELVGDNNKNVTIPVNSHGERSYTANWDTIPYSLSYALNGGSASNPTSYNVETETFTLTNPTRTAYDFVGWSGTGLTGNTNTTVSVTTGSYGNRSYTANWNPTNYSISYNLNGGSASNATSYNIESGAITLNNPTRAHYTFAGWSGTGLTGTANMSVTIPAGSTGARSYTANWTPFNYTITYNLNGGSASNPTTYNIETNTFTLNNPTKAGVTFSGWSGTGLSGTANKTVTITKGSTGTRSYTANWAPTTTTWNYAYTGGVQTFAVPATGTYKLEVWGAQGGGAGSADTSDARKVGGKGGYSYGNAVLTAGQTIYIVVGGQGSYGTQSNAASGLAGGYNGGGNGGGQTPAGTYKGGGSGGGATHIGKQNALLKNTTSSNVYIVAGGGGAGYYHEWDEHDLGGTDGEGGNGSGGGAYGQGGNGGGGVQAAGGGGGWAGGVASSGQFTTATGGTGYIGGVTGGSMQSGQRSGSGYARITWVGN